MSALTSELKSFISESNIIFSEGKARALALPANTVQVWPGGATFSTIQDAINSIKNASPQLQYQVAVGPGTYKENIVMIDYVYVIGSGQSNTIISAAGQQNPINGVVNSASGGGISEVTINAGGGGWGTWPIGIKLCGSGKFHISGVNINSGDPTVVGNNVRGISNNTGSYTGSVILGSSIISAQGGDNSTPLGIELLAWGGEPNPMTLFVDVSSIQVNGTSSSFGVTTANGGTVTLDDSKIIAGTWALYDSDGASLITANQCTISGPVSSGVVVNN